MRTTRPLALALVAFVSLTTTALAAKPSPPPAIGGASAADEVEAATVKLQDFVEAQGGLGIHWAKNEWVVARPSVGGESLTAERLDTFGIPVAVETMSTDKATVDHLSADLETLHGKVNGDFGFGFDSESGRVIVSGSVPEVAFQAIENTYPGLLEYRAATWQTTDARNDSPPYFGGAWLQSSITDCTAGYSITNNAGNRYMVTAGHCFPNGAATNMGTAIRPSQGDPWPYWDWEIIGGRSYSATIYDSVTTSRRVKNASNPGANSVYCTDGRRSGFRCDGKVKNIDQTLCIDGMPDCWHNLAEFTWPDGRVVVPGDSGGTFWYKYSDGSAGIRGTISANSCSLIWGCRSFATQYQKPADFMAMYAMTR